eukprot:c8747_g1_i2.p1 GENE.c8747_g1_i2~~c8747_g1_i2.p1  ORF type:complete len:155 (+),score=25.13 c8747_g1_i2:91-555(+)
MQPSTIILLFTATLCLADRPDYDRRVTDMLHGATEAHPFRQVSEKNYYPHMPLMTLHRTDNVIFGSIRVLGTENNLHVISKVHYIKAFWIADDLGNTVFLQEFPDYRDSTPEIEFGPLDLATISGTVLKPYSWCSKHGFWEGPPIVLAHLENQA